MTFTIFCHFDVHVCDTIPFNTQTLATNFCQIYLLQNFPIDSSVSSNDYASFFIDFYLDTPSESCGHGHRFLLQFMFDNRQAIGTNLLKFDIASRNAALRERQTTSIALCVEKSRVRQLGWDGSAASAQEYIDAVLGPYNKVITNIPVVFAIDNLTQEE